ncbi:unnamed protein product [Strongylus vulgaris]|uniref:Galectin n=1 Tax=Strongylus vulgaris TaxID=40348 RepID=A0A3P7JBQ1_STRVU|nr:unnamed protein product [Strongylus vulgaris]
MHLVHNPPVPSAIPIHEQLRDGCKIDVHGRVLHGHYKNFAVELLSGPHIVLHVNFRFHHEHAVVMNSCSHGTWGPEHIPSVIPIHEHLHPGCVIDVHGVVEHGHHKNFAIELVSGPHIVLHVRHNNPLHHGDHFHLHISVHQNHYEIQVNGHHLADYVHRFPMESVQGLGLKGDVKVEKVDFSGFHFNIDWNNQHDFGHAGYNSYGTEHYQPPTVCAQNLVNKLNYREKVFEVVDVGTLFIL